MSEPNSQDATPVIKPSELAAILAKSTADGFSPSHPGRGMIAADAEDFSASDFVNIARMARPLPTEESVETKSEPAAEPPKPQPAFHEAKAEKPRDFAAELEAARKAGWDEGYLNGVTAGREEAQAEFHETENRSMEDARSLLLAAASRLSNLEDSDVETLQDAMLSAIARLASERTGREIDTHPTAFLTKVLRVAERISQGTRNVTLSMNPSDLRAIHGQMGDDAGRLPAMVPEAGLGRGDFVVRTGGIELADILALDTPEQDE